MQRARVALPVWSAHQLRRSSGERSVRRPIVVWYNRRREKTVPAREIEVKGKTEERTERASEKKEVADLLVLPRPAKTLQNGAGFSGKT